MGVTTDRCVYLEVQPGVSVLHARFRGHAFDPHAHDLLAIGVTEHGVQCFHCAGRARAAIPGDIIVLAPGEKHDGWAGHADGFAYRMLYIDPAHALDLLEDAAQRPLPRLPGPDAPVLHRSPLAAVIRRAHARLADPNGVAMAADEALQDVLAGLFPSPSTTSGLAALPHAVRRARDLMRSDPAAPLSAAALARASGAGSRFALTRAFTSRYGVPPSRYLLQLRLEAARAAIAAGIPLAEAAVMGGFCDQSHLTRHFHTAYGQTPGRFAAQTAVTAVRTSVRSRRG